ncbi:hypothetical protein OHT77_39315 [Streptomyces sp. NBC_00252]|uniref:hypothetical protein n=1 Tax=Streptomyces sp. NBC_00252 TaxID=2975691 RepID=UPI002E2B2CB9|nr:hypothetical protein [Streptomyces sp. NBC_00252]
MKRFVPGAERIAITAKRFVVTGEPLGLAPERSILALEQNIRATERFIRAIDEQWPAASCGTAAPESLWSHVTLGLPAITLRTSPPDTTAGGLSLTSLLDPNSVFFRTSVGESQP